MARCTQKSRFPASVENLEAVSQHQFFRKGWQELAGGEGQLHPVESVSLTNPYEPFSLIGGSWGPQRCLGSQLLVSVSSCKFFPALCTIIPRKLQRKYTDRARLKQESQAAVSKHHDGPAQLVWKAVSQGVRTFQMSTLLDPGISPQRPSLKETFPSVLYVKVHHDFILESHWRVYAEIFR